MLELNPEQVRAASHGEGPMLVLAGPGTGKTLTLVGRQIFLMSRGILPRNILSLTFTRKAAANLKFRIARSAKLEMKAVMTGTFHALALTLASEAPNSFPRLSGRKLADEKATDNIMKRVLRDVPMDTDEAALLIAGFKDQLITPAAQMEEAMSAEGPKRVVSEALANAYARYQDQLETNGLYDFADLISGVIDGLERDPSLARRLSERFSHVMIDEYQDINLAQHKFIEKLLTSHHNIWVVGDDDQALYGWRHADVRYILDFEKNYPGAKVSRLEKNYRSQANILTFAGGIIARNHARFDKKFSATRPAEGPVRIHVAATVDDEADWVAGRILDLHENGTELDHISVLARVGYHLVAVERALHARGLPVQVVGATPFWTSQAVTLYTSLYNAMEPRVGLPETEERAPKWLVDKLTERRRNRDFLPLSRMIINELLENPPKKQAADDERKAVWRHTLEQLLTEIETADDAAEIAMKISAGKDSIENEKRVTACTIHGSKGLEWKHVFLIGMEEGVIPHRRSDDIEEERRLAYVAATRAADELYISMALERAKRETRPSRFLEEGISASPKEILNVTRAT